MAGLEFDDDIFNEFAEDDNWADTELINVNTCFKCTMF